MEGREKVPKAAAEHSRADAFCRQRGRMTSSGSKHRRPPVRTIPVVRRPKDPDNVSVEHAADGRSWCSTVPKVQGPAVWWEKPPTAPAAPASPEIFAAGRLCHDQNAKPASCTGIIPYRPGYANSTSAPVARRMY